MKECNFTKCEDNLNRECTCSEFEYNHCHYQEFKTGCKILREELNKYKIKEFEY